MDIHVVQHTHGGLPDVPQLLVSAAAATTAMLAHFDDGLCVDGDDRRIDRDAVQHGDITYLSTPGGRYEARWYRIDVPGLRAE